MWGVAPGSGKADGGAGRKVLGVELAPAWRRSPTAEESTSRSAPFEEWDAARRSFDRVTSAQAWHWLDMPVATAKAASLLRPNGILGLIWSGGAHPDDLADRLEEVYSTVVPPGTHRLFHGYGANRSTDVRSGLTGVFDAIAAAPDLGAATERWFPWAQHYQRDEWLELLRLYSEYAASSRTSETVCSMGRDDDRRLRRLVRHELRDGPDRRDPARLTVSPAAERCRCRPRPKPTCGRRRVWREPSPPPRRMGRPDLARRQVGAHRTPTTDVSPGMAPPDRGPARPGIAPTRPPQIGHDQRPSRSDRTVRGRVPSAESGAHALGHRLATAADGHESLTDAVVMAGARRVPRYTE